MAWSGGVYTKLYSWVTRAAIPENILPQRFDEQESDIETGLNNCLTKDGLNRAAADIPPASNRTYSLGTSALRWLKAYLGTQVNFRSR